MFILACFKHILFIVTQIMLSRVSELSLAEHLQGTQGYYDARVTRVSARYNMRAGETGVERLSHTCNTR